MDPEITDQENTYQEITVTILIITDINYIPLFSGRSSWEFCKQEILTSWSGNYESGNFVQYVVSWFANVNCSSSSSNNFDLIQEIMDQGITNQEIMYINYYFQIISTSLFVQSRIDSVLTGNYEFRNYRSGNYV